MSGRWHTKGRPVVYCTSNPATALLENIVHLEIESEDRPEHFRMLKIEGPDSLSIQTIRADSLPLNWAKEVVITQAAGDRWLSGKHFLLLQVPSALVPETWNVLVNPQHPEASLLKITKVYEHAFDPRLF